MQCKEMDYNQILKSGIYSRFSIPVNFCDSSQSGSFSISNFMQPYYYQPSYMITGMVYKITVKVVLPLCRSEQVEMKNTDSVYSLKEIIARMEDIPIKKISLVHNGSVLNDLLTLSAAGIGNWNNVVYMTVLNPSGMINLDISLLDPKYDCDFTNMKGEGYKRGGYVYDRPYGWFRLGLRVLDKHEYGSSNAWIGTNVRYNQYWSAPGEWPVSYHGTKRFNVERIVSEGFRAGDRARFGQGVYTCPSINIVANMYAEPFQHTDGQWYQIAFQNRVNPDRVSIIDKAYTGVGADYWVSCFQDVDRNIYDVRPYGILIRKWNSQ